MSAHDDRGRDVRSALAARDSVYPDQFDMLNIPDRITELGDLWARILEARIDLAQLLG